MGQFATATALMMDGGRVIAIDDIPSRIEMARSQGSEVVYFELNIRCLPFRR